MKTFKHFLFSVIIVFVLTNAGWGQIISQYVETNSGSVPKGIEICNNTDNIINFATTPLVIAQGTNGAALADIAATTINTGTLGIGEVLVIGTSDIGTYLTNQGLTDVTFLSYTFTFNGDDALAVKLNNTITDVFGNPGSDPGTSWSGSGVNTANQNIAILLSVSGGDLDGWTDPSLRFSTISTTPATLPEGLSGFGIAPTQFLPVTLSAFNYSVVGRNIKLNWTTTEEINNSGFDVQKSVITDQGTEIWEKIGFVEGKGTKNTPTSYSFEDRNMNTGKYMYRLKQVDFNGNYEYFELNGEVEIGVPRKYDVSQNYPNPFNPVTKINFDLPENGLVNIRLYDMLGREVAVIVNEVRNAGYHTVQFDGSKLSSGIYFYKMSAGKFNGIKKMSLIK